MSNMDKTRPVTRHQYLFRLTSVCPREGIEFLERLGDEMRKHAMLGLESWDDGGMGVTDIIYCRGMAW